MALATTTPILIHGGDIRSFLVMRCSNTTSKWQDSHTLSGVRKKKILHTIAVLMMIPKTTIVCLFLPAERSCLTLLRHHCRSEHFEKDAKLFVRRTQKYRQLRLSY